MLELKKVNLTKENLEKIKQIDDLFYNEDILTLDWYIERYNKNHNGILLCDGKDIVGYLVAVPIKKELYDSITNGVLTNDLYINPKMIINSSKYNYIVSIVILENYRHMGYAKAMLDELLKNNKDKYCALTITKDGYNFANKYMKHKLKINDDVSVFTI